MADRLDLGPEGDLKYQCRIFSVYEGEVLLPGGKVSRQSWINHDPCIAVIPVTEDGRILLIRQYRHAVRRDLIEIPAGRLEGDGESIESCVQRELAEETGFQAKRLIKLFAGYLIPGYGNEFMHYFLALDLYRAPLPPDEDEFISILPTSLDEAEAMMADGRIEDSKTALGIVLALSHLKTKGP